MLDYLGRVSLIVALEAKLEEIFGVSFTLADEKAMSQFLKAKLNENQVSRLKVYWPETMVVDWPELEANPKGWYWENGRLFDRENRERFYLHFMTWKKFMNHIDFQSGEQISKFTITRRGIWSMQPPVLARFLETTQLGSWYRLQPLHLRKKSGKISSAFKFGERDMFKFRERAVSV